MHILISLGRLADRRLVRLSENALIGALILTVTLPALAGVALLIGQPEFGLLWPLWRSVPVVGMVLGVPALIVGAAAAAEDLCRARR
ncbi:hypothetical protein GKE82_23675 [Conexibacter sp. W3-3-2]|uniref:hypothetical protein n=1 Tax=Conexibacter sp. W3-3-2 TaxID=2675227 RepID=UPI0012B91A8C|nr:hypothetical protein [Conexibacter sp. W3-3-2]MTD47206.1 hypothetical protein [Conexibacter sp. W3-3-2]